MLLWDEKGRGEKRPARRSSFFLRGAFVPVMILPPNLFDLFGRSLLRVTQLRKELWKVCKMNHFSRSLSITFK
jgi:hypothetical protein